MVANVIDLGDVGVPQPGDRLGLGLEAYGRLFAGVVAGQNHLQGAETIQADLTGQIDHSHAAAAEFVQNLVAGYRGHRPPRPGRSDVVGQGSPRWGRLRRCLLHPPASSPRHRRSAGLCPDCSGASVQQESDRPANRSSHPQEFLQVRSCQRTRRHRSSRNWMAPRWSWYRPPGSEPGNSRQSWRSCPHRFLDRRDDSRSSPDSPRFDRFFATIPTAVRSPAFEAKK